MGRAHCLVTPDLHSRIYAEAALRRKLFVLDDKPFDDGTHRLEIVSDLLGVGYQGQQEIIVEGDEIRFKQSCGEFWDPRAFRKEAFMRHCAYGVIALSLATGVSMNSAPAWAADRARAEPVEGCKPLAKVKALFDAKTTHFTALTPGQLNFARGAYVDTPPVSAKMPAGDAAILAEHAGSRGGIMLWTLGPLVCEPSPVWVA